MWKFWVFCVFSTILLTGICNATEHEPDTCKYFLKYYDKSLKSHLATLDRQLQKFQGIDEKLDALLNTAYNREKYGKLQLKTHRKLFIFIKQHILITFDHFVQVNHLSSCAKALVKAPYSGIHSINMDSYGPKKFLVYCDATTQGGGWTVIQRRQDGSVDFLRKWADYKKGFGNLEGEFFIGLDKLHAITTETPHELLIVMKNFADATKYAKYDSFAIGSEDEDYVLNVLGSYSGDVGDSLRIQASQKFTTIDRDNDNKNSTNCAVEYKGAWWYDNCHLSNLNGFYYKDGNVVNGWASGIHWQSWDGHRSSLKYVEMFIRPITK